MKIKLQIIAVVLWAIASINASASDFRINSHGKATIVQTERINSIEYAPLNSISKLILPSSNCKGSSVFFEGIEIKAAVGSFYILHRTSSDMKVAQMSLPTIYFNNAIYVPLESFLSVLANMGLIKYDQTDAGFFIELQQASEQGDETASEKPVAPKKPTVKKSNVAINVARPNKPSKESAEITDEPDTDVYQSVPQSDPAIPPNKYHIPDKLDRSVIKKK